MQVTVNPTVKINDTTIPDFKSFSVSNKLAIAETAFDIQLDRPIEVSTDDTASISYNITGSEYDLVKDKKIEVTDRSTMTASIRGEGSLISRFAPFRSVIFINQVWLDKMYPGYLYKDGIILKPIVGIDATGGKTQFNGVSTNRLFVDELPGKDVKDIEFECILTPGLSYSNIRQYISTKTGYKINCNLPEMYVQKTFVIGSGEPFFTALDRLYGFWNAMCYIRDDTIHIIDAGGDAQNHPSGTGMINITEDSFSVLKYNVNDTQQVVDHLLLVGPSSNWTYRGMRTNSLNKYRLHEGTLPGISQTLVHQFNYVEETGYNSGVVQAALSAEGITEDLSIFENSNQSVDKNGSETKTIEMKINPDTGDSVITKQTVETHTIAGALVHKTEIKYRHASYSQPLGHTYKEWARIGVVGGGTTQQMLEGYGNVIPASYEFRLINMTNVEFGNFIGDTGLYEADVTKYALTVYILDEDNYTINGEDTSVPVKKRPQQVHVNSMIGVTPASWEEPDDPESPLGWQTGFCKVGEEKITYNVSSQYILVKNRLVTTYLPHFARKMYTEDIPLKRGMRQGTVIKKWEYFNTTAYDGTVTIYQYQEGSSPPSLYNVPLLPGSSITGKGLFHPKMTVNIPDLVDDAYALRIAKRIFSKKLRKNTTATLRFTTPLPGISVGMVVNVPTCTKEVFDYNSTGWAEVELAGMMMWITGIRTVCSYSGDVGSASRSMDFYTEVELKKNF